MMSHPRIRKTALAGEGGPDRVPPANTAGDVKGVNGAMRADQATRAKSRNKLPKSLRYDLENALVDLCDVWFENIKPYLTRNNIKLHVYDGATMSKASDDHDRLPSGATGCSHLDPGAALDHCPMAANCAGCSATRLPASTAPSPKPPVSSPHPPQIHLPSSPITQVHITIPNSKRSNKKSRMCKRRKRLPVSHATGWRVPRLCRTYNFLIPAATPRNQRRFRPASPSQLRMPKPYTHYSANEKRKGMCSNKSTQTEYPSLTGTFNSSGPKPVHTSTSAFTRLQENRCVGTTALTESIQHEKKSRRSCYINDHNLFKMT